MFSKRKKSLTEAPIYDQGLHEQLAKLGFLFTSPSKYVPHILTEPFHDLLKNEINVATAKERSTENWDFLMALYHVNTTEYTGNPEEKARAVHLALLEVIDDFIVKVHVHTDESKLDKATAKKLQKFRAEYKETEEDKTELHSPAYKERMRPHAPVKDINLPSGTKADLIKKVDPDYEDTVAEQVDKHKFSFPPVKETEKTDKHRGEVYVTLPLSKKTDKTALPLLVPSDFVKAAIDISGLMNDDSFSRYSLEANVKIAAQLDDQVKFIIGFLKQYQKDHAKHHFLQSDTDKAITESSKAAGDLENAIEKLYKNYGNKHVSQLAEFQKDLKSACESFLHKIPNIIESHGLSKQHSPKEHSHEALESIEKLVTVVTCYTETREEIAKFIEKQGGAEEKQMNTPNPSSAQSSP